MSPRGTLRGCDGPTAEASTPHKGSATQHGSHRVLQTVWAPEIDSVRPRTTLHVAFHTEGTSTDLQRKARTAPPHASPTAANPPPTTLAAMLGATWSRCAVCGARDQRETNLG